MVKEVAYYQTLGITPEATQAEIKRAYRLMALKWHPDKNKHNQESTAKFQEITKVYEVLINPKSRAIYDRYGEDHLNTMKETVDPAPRPSKPTSSGFSMGPEDLFSEFLGRTGFGSFPTPPDTGAFPFQRAHFSKKHDIKHKLACSLEELYKGKTAKLGLSRVVLCKTCDAKGGIKVHQCPHCAGRGSIRMQRRMGPISQKYEVQCDACSGSGGFIEPNDLCPKCMGSKTVEERKILTLSIPPGTRTGTQIVLEGDGDQGIGMITGDVVVTIEEKVHDKFKRKLSNLYYTADIDLLTALTGGSFVIQHLNGDLVKVGITPGEIIKPSSRKVIKGSGMPYPDSTDFGDMIVTFKVIFPESSQLNEESVKLLTQALPSKPQVDIPDDTFVMEKKLSEYDPQKHAFSDSSKFDERNNKKRKKSTSGPGSFYGPSYFQASGESGPDSQCTSQ